jgi:hypothetical protein
MIDIICRTGISVPSEVIWRLSASPLNWANLSVDSFAKETLILCPDNITFRRVENVRYIFSPVDFPLRCEGNHGGKTRGWIIRYWRSFKFRWAEGGNVNLRCFANAEQMEVV